MRTWIGVFLFAIDVLLLSLPLALFEILLERQYGWAGRLDPDGWGKRLFTGTIIADSCEKLYLTPYHIVMFALVVPAILGAQFLLAKQTTLLHQISSIQPLLFSIAVWFSLLSVEDVLWFAFNWYYPDSWRDLTSGRIWWHTKWVGIGSVKLPRFYLTTQVLALAFLIVSLEGRGIVF